MKGSDEAGDWSAMDIRKAALNILDRVEKQGAFSTILIRKTLDSARIAPREARLLSNLVYGVLKYRNTLDWIIGQHRKRGGRIRPALKNVLRLGVYQVLFLNSVPAYAACNTTVRLARGACRHEAEVRFVNALLRSVTNSGEITYPDEADDLSRHLAIKHSHPVWLVERWQNRFGPDETGRYCQANNRTPSLSLRVNTAAATVDEAIKALGVLQVTCRRGRYAPDIVLIPRRQVHQLKKLPVHLFSIQDEASALVVHLLEPSPGERILDFCAGLGTKTLHIMELTRGEADIAAVDIHRFKLEKLLQRCAVCGFPAPAVHACDAAADAAAEAGVSSLEQDLGLFHRVLVDAPCSGLGTVRHKPELKWKASLDKLFELKRLQVRLLSAAARCVASGGRLLYSTCSTEPEETSLVIDEFLEKHADFEPAPLTLPGEPAAMTLTGEDTSRLVMYPHVHGTDGFFVAGFKCVR